MYNGIIKEFGVVQAEQERIQESLKKIEQDDRNRAGKVKEESKPKEKDRGRERGSRWNRYFNYKLLTGNHLTKLM